MKDDQEIAAVQAVAQALQPLNRAEAQRVLAWADSRFCGDAFPPLSFDAEEFRKFCSALQSAAAELGNVAPVDILRFVEKVKGTTTEGAT